MKNTGLQLILAWGTFIGLCYLGYLFDDWLIGSILKEIPESGYDWLGIIEIALWIVATIFTGLPIFAASATIAKAFLSSDDTTHKSRTVSKSRFQEKLEKMAKERGYNQN